MAYTESRNVNDHNGDTGILIRASIAAARRAQKSQLQYDIAQKSNEAQNRAANDPTHRTAGVIGAGVSGVRSAVGTGGSRAGGMGSRESGRNDRRGGRDRNGGSAFFNLVVDPCDKRSQVSVLYVVGEGERFDSWDRTREVLRRGEVIALGIDDDGVPVILLKGEAREIGTLMY